MKYSKTKGVVCPAQCTGGYADKVHTATADRLKMTAEQMTLIGVKHSEQLHHCWYCDSVWRTGTDGGKDIIGRRMAVLSLPRDFHAKLGARRRSDPAAGQGRHPTSEMRRAAMTRPDQKPVD